MCTIVFVDQDRKESSIKTIKAEPRQGDKVAVIIRVDSTLQEEIILTAKEGMALASEILNALPNAPIRS